MGEVELRISDADRERAAALLHTAVGDGRITWDEHEERVAAVYAARTERELYPHLADLRPGPPPPSVRPTGSAEQVVCTAVRRRPDPADGPVLLDVTLGAAEIDLRDLPRGAVVDVRVNTLGGKVDILVSPGTRLHDSGTASFGSRTVVERGGWKRMFRPVPVHADGPVVRLSGHLLVGHVRVTIG